MKPYIVLEIAEGKDEATIVATGESRNEAYTNLGLVAEAGNTYIECRTLGKPIVPKERTSVVLSREDISEVEEEEAE